MMNRYSISACVLVAFVATGCFSGSGQVLYPVEGTITKNGVPLVDANLEFNPRLAGATSYGKSDESGHFTLYYSTGKPGAAPGEHTVRVIGGRAGSEPKPSEPSSPEGSLPQIIEYQGKEIVVTIEPGEVNNVAITL